MVLLNEPKTGSFFESFSDIERKQLLLRAIALVKEQSFQNWFDAQTEIEELEEKKLELLAVVDMRVMSPERVRLKEIESELSYWNEFEPSNKDGLLIDEFIDGLGEPYSNFPDDKNDPRRTFRMDSYRRGWMRQVNQQIENERLLWDFEESENDPQSTQEQLFAAVEAHQSIQFRLKRKLALTGEHCTDAEQYELDEARGFMACAERCRTYICGYVHDDEDPGRALRHFEDLKQRIVLGENDIHGFGYRNWSHYSAKTPLQAHQERITKRTTENKFDVYSMPGFVDELMAITLDSAPYPNKPLAFCGALSLLSLVVARRVSFYGLFPNLYLLGLATSGSGKDHPRKVNNLALNECGMGGSLGDAFASGEGLEEAMFRNNAMLFQCDEFDSIVRSMANEKESRFESITERLLRFYSSSSVTYMLRQKANDEGQRSITRPHLSLFATCVPSSFVDSISKKMTTSGLIARMIVVNAGKRGQGKRTKPIAISESIKDQIRHWQIVGSESGNLSPLNPVPLELESENTAHIALDRARVYFDEMYDHRFDNGDEGGMAIWARAYENTCKLAILYACSQNVTSPQITKEGVEWARGFVNHHVKAILEFVDNGMSESPFDKLVNRIKAKIGAAENGIARSDLLRFSKVDRKEFDKVIDTLMSREEVVPVQQQTPGRTGLVYLLA